MRSETLQRYLNEVGSQPRLDREEELRLAALVRQGDRAARDKMVCSNLRLVVTIAGDFFKSGLPFLDLVSEGNLGLIKAVERFDPERRCRLATYAAWWIREFISRAVYKQSGVISVPPRAVRKAAKLRGATEHLAQRLGREPTEEELSLELGMSRDSISALRKGAVYATSLETPSADGEGRLLDTLPNENSRDPSEEAHSLDLLDRIEVMMRGLSVREREVVRRRFGFEDGSPKKLQEIGNDLGYTRERIRQIEAKALEKMRAGLRLLELKQLSGPQPSLV